MSEHKPAERPPSTFPVGSGQANFVRHAESLIVSDPSQAVAILTERFAAGPRDERVCVLLLHALARTNDAARGAEVFGQAAAEYPSSTAIRLAWAEFLLALDQGDEARRRAREALDLNPKDEAVRAFIARVGGVAPTIHRRRLGEPAERHDRALEPMPSKRSHHDVKRMGQASAGTRGATRVEFSEAGSIAALTSPESEVTDATSLQSATSANAEDDKGTVRDDTQPIPPIAVHDRPTARSAPSPMTRRTGSRALPQARPQAVLARVSRREARDNARKRYLAFAVVAFAVALALSALWRTQKARHDSDDALVAQSLATTIADTYASWIAASDELGNILARRPTSNTAHAALALVNAQLWSRFTSDDALRHEAHEHLARAGSVSGPESHTALALLHIGAREVAEAERQLAMITGSEEAWQQRVAHALLAVTKGDAARAEGIFADELAREDAVPAVLHLAATYFRQTGDTDRANRAIQSGASRSPDHPAWSIEALHVRLANGAEISPEEFGALERMADPAPRYKAQLAVMAAQVALDQRRSDDARDLVERARRLMPSDTDVRIAQAQIELLPEGDAAQAAKHLRAIALLPALAPHYQLLSARVALLLGQADRAQEALDRIGTNQAIRPIDQIWLNHVSRQTASELGSIPELLRLCATPESETAIVDCVELLFASGQNNEASRLLALQRPSLSAASRDYLEGIHRLDRQDFRAAADLLTRAEPEAQLEPGRRLVWLGIALRRQGALAESTIVLRRAVSIDARSARSRLALAQTLLREASDTEEAAELLRTR